jgi:eukaryotic-like serine/threonine-protein kinase
MPRTEERLLDDRYELVRRIGVGGMGEVHEARDRRLDRTVAVKLLRPELTSDVPARRRIAEEARLAARIRHPNVVTVLGHGEDDGRPYLVMECLSGRSLRDAMHERRLDDAEVRDVGLQVLDALAAAHALDVVHRDVKPGNVLEAEPAWWKVADFGIAKWLHADQTLTGTGELIGSPSYLAPERLEGVAATPASDLYGAGVLLYEALCGRRPFEGDDPWAVALAVRDGVFPHPAALRPDADPWLCATIVRAMAHDPRDRFVSAEEFRDALEQRRDDGHTVALRSSTVAPARSDRSPEPSTRRSDARPRVRERGPLAAVLAVVMLVGLLLFAAPFVFDARVPDAATPEPRRTPATLTDLPGPLAGALERLDEAVRP